MFSLFLQDAWKVLLYSVVLGAGLPIVYALGVRSLALGSGSGTSEVDANPGRNPVGTVLAAICFLVVLVGVGVGLTYVIAAGKGEQLSFSHVYPTIVPKS
jgi:hypothetical protein